MVLEVAPPEKGQLVCRRTKAWSSTIPPRTVGKTLPAILTGLIGQRARLSGVERTIAIVVIIIFVVTVMRLRHGMSVPSAVKLAGLWLPGEPLTLVLPPSRREVLLTLLVEPLRLLGHVA
jgi:hypothetical protein